MDTTTLIESIRKPPAHLGRHWGSVGLALAKAKAADPDGFGATLWPVVETAAIPDPLPLSSVPAILAWASVHPTLTFSAGLPAANMAEELGRLLDSDAMSRVRALALVAPTEEALAALAAHAGLAQVEQLSVRAGTSVGDALLALARSPHLAVTSLQMIEVTPNGVPELVRAAAARLAFRPGPRDGTAPNPGRLGSRSRLARAAAAGDTSGDQARSCREARPRRGPPSRMLDRRPSPAGGCPAPSIRRRGVIAPAPCRAPWSRSARRLLLQRPTCARARAPRRRCRAVRRLRASSGTPPRRPRW